MNDISSVMKEGRMNKSQKEVCSDGEPTFAGPSSPKVPASTMLLRTNKNILGDDSSSSSLMAKSSNNDTPHGVNTDCDVMLETMDTCVALINGVDADHHQQHHPHSAEDTQPRTSSSSLDTAAVTVVPDQSSLQFDSMVSYIIPRVEDFSLCGNTKEHLDMVLEKNLPSSSSVVDESPTASMTSTATVTPDASYYDDYDTVLETMDSCVVCAEGVDLQHDYENGIVVEQRQKQRRNNQQEKSVDGQVADEATIANREVMKKEHESTKESFATLHAASQVSLSDRTG